MLASDKYCVTGQQIWVIFNGNCTFIIKAIAGGIVLKLFCIMYTKIDYFTWYTQNIDSEPFTVYFV